VYLPSVPCLALSALALSHRFSGFRSLWPLEFISPRNTLGFLLQSFLLREIGCSFLRDFVAFRSPVRLLSLAATRSCYRVSRLNPVLSTTLQFDFRGFFPLAARSVGSGVSRLQWSMLSWFSILFRGFVSLCCALSILISIDVTPLLRRRLYGLQEACFAFSGLYSPLLVGSTVRLLIAPLLLRLLCSYPLTGSLTAHLQTLNPRLFVAGVSCLFQPLAQRRFVPTV